MINTVSASLDILNTQLGGTEGTIPATATKVEALREIYATLGGTDDVSNISTVSEMVEKVAEVASGGGGGGGTVELLPISVTNNTGGAIEIRTLSIADGSNGKFLNEDTVYCANNATKSINASYYTAQTDVNYLMMVRATASSLNLTGLTASTSSTKTGAIVESVYQDEDSKWNAVVKVLRDHGNTTAISVTLAK